MVKDLIKFKPLIKFSVTHKRNDAPIGSLWGAYIWAENQIEAWEKARYLETKIPMVHSITIEGVLLEEIETGIDVEAIQSSYNKELISVLPWFIYYQLDEIESYNEDKIDYDDLIKYFEIVEEFEKCANLVKRKNSNKEIKYAG